MLGIDVGSLIGARQKGRPPVLGCHDRIAPRTHGDEAGQVLVFRAQAVSDPGSHAGALQAAVAAVHQHERWLVIGHVGIHRADDAQVVDMLSRRAGEEITHFDAALAILPEGEGRAQGCAGLALGAQVGRGKRLAVVLRQQWLGIECVDVRRTAVHEEVDNLLCLRGKVRRLRCHGAERSGWLHVRACAAGSTGQTVVGHHARQPDQPEPHAAALEELAPGQCWGRIVLVRQFLRHRRPSMFLAQ